MTRLAFLKDWYETQFNEFVDTVYLDEEWIEGRHRSPTCSSAEGWCPKARPPRSACIDPESGEETCLLPSS